ncbi:DUF722 domain-containing protein [Alkalihalobacillus trypoxylicola]|uniref:Transcriptional regulator n=1 Tax=Alkalihalobacillus trypoxylicola TaxID=519424 RepID=A0A161PHA3_9BACI|nr:DUF722 domain-containing protein [Alkalihalobacillus trypoxylicola]KYG28163.1 transcriptional regulator [Alkalihalobacillus trypoxylicola]
MAIKTRKPTFKHIEAEWSNYHETLKEIANLRQEIINPFDEEINDPTVIAGTNSVRCVGHPTEQIAVRLSANKRLDYLESMATTIEQVYNALPDNYKELIRLRYWRKEKLKWDGVAMKLYISERQARRWRNDIMQATAEQLGWR